MMMKSRFQIKYKQLDCGYTSRSYLIFGLDFDTYLFDVEDSGRSADQNHRKDRADKTATSITIQNKQPSLQHVELEMHKYKVVQV